VAIPAWDVVETVVATTTAVVLGHGVDGVSCAVGVVVEWARAAVVCAACATVGAVVCCGSGPQ
jgi:hypothetical protein